MDKNRIIETIGEVLEQRGCFLVYVTVSADNDIEIGIEKREGSVDMDDCIAVNDVVLDAFDRDVEDYALTVTSAGLDQPFMVYEQYVKAVGEKVEVLTRDGRKIVAVLKEAAQDSVTVSYMAKEAVEGKKKKVLVEKVETLALDALNAVKYHIEFE